MELMLSPYAKTMPSNYSIQGVDVDLSLEPGSSCTEEEWAKAERMESEYFDWESYMYCQMPKMEHPVYAKRIDDHLLVEHWEEVLHKLEPLRYH